MSLEAREITRYLLDINDELNRDVKITKTINMFDYIIENKVLSKINSKKFTIVMLNKLDEIKHQDDRFNNIKINVIDTIPESMKKNSDILIHMHIDKNHHTVTCNLELKNKNKNKLDYSDLNQEEKELVYKNINDEIQEIDIKVDFEIDNLGKITYTFLKSKDECKYFADDLTEKLSQIDMYGNKLIREEYIMVFFNIILDRKKTDYKSSDLRLL